MGFDDSRFDMYDNVGSRNEDYDAEPSQIDAVKQYLPKIVIAIVVLAVAYFAYDYFIGSVTEVSFDIENTEGNKINSTILVYDSQNNEAYNSSSGNKANLRFGDYTYEVTANGYKQEMGDFTISANNKSVKIEIEKDMDIEFGAVSFAGGLSLTSPLQGTVELKNNDSETHAVELVFEGDFDEYDVIIFPSTASVPGNGNSIVNVTATPKEGTEIKKSSGDSKKGTIRVKYLNSEKAIHEVNFKLYKETEIDTPSKVTLSVKYNDSDNKNVKIENDNDFEIKNVKLELDILGSTINDTDDILSWISFPYGSEIDSIPAKGEHEFKIQIDTPLDAKKEDIEAQIRVTSASTDETITIELSIKITDEAETALEVSISSSAQNIEIEWDIESEKFEKVEKYNLEIDNKGDVTISEIQISVKNNAECITSWLSILSPAVGTLTAGDDTEVPITISAPNAVYGKEANSISCEFEISYDDPFGGPRIKQAVPQNIQITANWEDV
ncbi:MAG: hypothetical protein V1672_00225 [Candidatus Diapherotrites archaeon]